MPRSLGDALKTVSPEGEMLNQLQCIMHAEEVEHPLGQDTVLQTELDEHEYEQEVDEGSDGSSDEDAPLAPAAAPLSSTALVTAGSACTSVRASTKLAVTRATHLQDLQCTALSGKACGCPRASQQGFSSCLDTFSKAELSEFYAEAHGPMASPWAKAKVLMELHKKIWAMKQALPNIDALGRKYKVPMWMLKDKAVCQVAWLSAYNYTPNGVRTHLALVLRGVGPAAEEARRLAATGLLSLKRMRAGKKDWATQWWRMHLELHDFLPNECTIQIRGAPWQVVYDQQFTPMASLVGMACCKSLWMQARPAALRQLCKKYYPERSPDELRLKRSANHSRFPECTTCSNLRKRCACCRHEPCTRPQLDHVPPLNDRTLSRARGAGRYLALATAPGAKRDLVDGAYNDLLRHNTEWGDDRKEALRLKFESSTVQAPTIYEGDDKCGSYWQKLPVDPTGRDSKQGAKAVFPFSIQANVIFGERGASRFAVTPKAVTTGGNFGLTNFVKALQRAKELGRLGPHVTGLYRHTDGGPDNLCQVTHLLHWLLVYLGCFQSIVWFRFEAGHSHTELADRLFSILKRLFATDNSSRPEGIGCFVELWGKLTEALKKTAETNEIAWNLSNWDFETWFAEMGIAGNFSRMSAVYVYKYEHDPTLWMHGGVKVTFKDRLSYKPPHGREAEWSPIKRVTRTEPGPNGAPMQVEANVTDEVGVIYIRRPPDLRKEPSRESLNEEKQDLAKACSSILKVRGGDLSDASKAFWEGLGKVFDGVLNAEQIPSLPHTFEVPSRGEPFRYTLDGTPCKLLPILKDLRRFDRPLIHWDPFNDAPPQEFSDTRAATPPGAPTRQTEQPPADEAPLRDPRATNVVVHDKRSLAQANADISAVDDEDWAADAPDRLEEEELQVGELYICKIANDDFKHELRIGLALLQGNASQGAGHKEVQWFARSSKTFKWPANPQFHSVYSGVCPAECFLLHVTNGMLTGGSVANKEKAPRFNSQFMKRLWTFCNAKGLVREPGAAAEAEIEEEDASSCAEDGEEEASRHAAPRRSRPLHNTPTQRLHPVRGDAGCGITGGAHQHLVGPWRGHGGSAHP